MGKFSSSMVLLLFSALYLTGLYGCGDSNASTGYPFYYFPERNVYYDVDNKEFSYTVDGGQSWSHSKSATDQLPSTLGKKVKLQSPVSNPWVQNREHRTTYNAVASDFTVLQDDPVTDAQNKVADVSKEKKGKKEEPNWGERDKVQKKKREDKKRDDEKFFKQLKEGFKEMKEDIKGVGKKN